MVNPKIEIKDSLIHGEGMFAKERISKGRISKGKVVVIWGHNYFSKEEADMAKKNNPDLRVQQIDDDFFEVFSKDEAKNDPTYFHNRSCDPNTWMDDKVTISARHDINSDEELTIDYAMFEMKERYVITENCSCGSERCRKIITGSDWRLPHLQERYKGHFSPLINRRIANLTF